MASQAGTTLDSGSGILKALSQAQDGTGDFATGLAKSAGLGIANAATGTAVGSNLGIAQSPNIALVFKGGNVRDHTFSWRFIPHNEEESVQLLKIVNELRHRALPKKQPGGWIIEYPGEVSIVIGGSNSGYLPFYKKCVITDVSVNYAPDGMPNFYRTSGAPTSINLSISLKETSLMYKSDLDDSDDNRLFKD
jgi:hypothetical protein